jgi:hypothetical protein
VIINLLPEEKIEIRNMRYLCIEAGLPFPEICTPEELM